ncbi:glycosyltransferase [Roseovarius dicentrarchi]|uniref:glycosyltransferase n=1 Tax=Roseovarius dicentrarchi TaxID=2250573 RepID=UPI0013967252|nr:glycosyltransferase [Roseovarius dicentrarchi]
MIVRDEAEVIAETLGNILSHFDITTWVIHDTGSRDNTSEIVTQFFKERGLEGKLRHRSWESFGANRQYALEDCAGLSDYVLFFDADNRIEGKVPELPAGPDAMTLNMRGASTIYPAKLIVKNNGSFRWRGIVHEGLYFSGASEKTQHISGDYAVVSRRAGARSRDSSTYYRDARLLVQAIENIGNEDRDLLPRYTFYCANSWRDAQAPHEAIPWYKKRISLGGWKDEVYLSWLGLGIELNKIGDQDGALLAFLSGQDVCPERAECLYQLARMQRMRGRPETALAFAREGLRRSLPDRPRLFVWCNVYAYWLDFEYLLCLKDLGRLSEGGDALERMRAANAPDHLYKILEVSYEKHSKRPG